MAWRGAWAAWMWAAIFAIQASAADPPRWKTEWECRWTDAAPAIDGRGDDPVWAGADVIEPFYLPWLGDRATAARAATKARLLWDRENLYFLAELDDADLFADLTGDDEKLWHNDVFELFFKPSDKSTGYYEFQVNAAGAKLDIYFPARDAGGYDKFKSEGRFGWAAKATRRGTLNQRDDRDTGWTVEGRFPWRDFLRTGGRPVVDERWKFALCRYDYSRDATEPELSTCAPLKSQTKPDFHHHEDYAALRFVGPPVGPVAKLLGWERYTPPTSHVRGSPDPPPPYRPRRVWPNLKLTYPVFVANEPGTRRLFIIDQDQPYSATRLRRTTDTPDDGRLETLLTYDGLAYSVAFHPRYAENGFLYVGYNDGPSGKKQSRITRYTIGRQPPFALDKNSARRIIEWDSDGHNGAAVTFGRDGMLYVTTGDGTSDSDRNVVGQRLDLLLGKVLRIDVDHPEEGRAYSIPRDNPFVGQKDVRGETWAYGLRNPWRMTTDPVTGHIWVGNNGQDLWEQAYLIERGANYGWSVYEGNHLFYPNRQLGPTPNTPPTVEHSHAEARSLTGGVVYHGQRLPDLRGAYIYGDHSTGKIWGVKHDGRRVAWTKELTDTPFNITAFAIDADGELLIADHRGDGGGGLYTLEPTPATAPRSSFPGTLSASGLFASVREHRVAPGVIPYTVNSPLWSDGAHKVRFIAIPADAKDAAVGGPFIEVTATRGWKFPDGAVLIKSFALDMEEGRPDSRRWIETRFLVKEQGEWIGYSYAWSDDQTDAVLVDSPGADKSFSIRTATGVREQKWRYPSRTECMVCHSRAANFILGLSTLQMNCEARFGDQSINQLVLLERLGMLRINARDEQVQQFRADLKAEKKTEREIDAAVDALMKKAPAGPLATMFARPPAAIPRLVDPYDSRQPLDARARSYLHANCAHCHVEAGGGNAQMDLEFATAREATKIFDVKPVHHTFGLSDPRLIAPGHPERSIILHRVATLDRGRMPQLATGIVDQPAVEMLRAWVRGMQQPIGKP